MDPSDAVELPEVPFSEPGLYRVDTASGTAHFIDTRGPRRTWRRQPAETSVAATYDHVEAPIRIAQDFTIGRCGYLEVRDESYLTGNTWHRTALIVRITRIE